MPNKKPRVGLFVTCLVDSFRPNVGFAAVRLLEKAGCQVEVPEAQTCCGQPAYNNGDETNALALARQVIETFESYDYVVAPSGSCAGMLHSHYPELFARQLPAWHERATQFAAKSYELVSFLTDVMKIDLKGVHYRGTVTYHDSCSGLRELSIQTQPRQLLNQINGLSLTEMSDTEACCGFGGTFCVKYPDISTRMVDEKIKNILKTEADTLLAGDMGCLLNISGRLKRLNKPVKVYHVAEVLANMTSLPSIGQSTKK